MSSKEGRTIFIGNISYGVTEEQIAQELLNKVGRLLNFRLVYDNENGKPKGFGFAEYSDVESADTARRNLDGRDYNGRQLRADFSHQGGKDDSNNNNANSMSQQQQQDAPPPNGTAAPPQANGLPALPPGVDLQGGLNCPDQISKTLNTLPPQQLLDILSQMKGLVVGDPSKATELLKQAPQLSYAIFQALLLMGLVDSSALSSVIQEATQPGQPPQPQQIPPPRPTPVGYQHPPPPPQQYGQYQPAHPPPPQHLQDPRIGHVPTPPVQGGMYQPPPQQQQAPPPPQQGSDQSALLQQVLAMSQAQVDMMPPMERAQIMQLRQQFGGRM